MSNPRDLYLTLLGDLLFVERMLSFEVIPQLLGRISSPPLAGAIAEHLEQTKQHARNVEQAFAAAGAETSSNHSRPFVALCEQHRELAGAAVVPAVADVLHAQAALATEHYEIAGYDVLIECARQAAPDAVKALAENRSQEEHAAKRLRELLGDLIQACSTAATVQAR